MAKYRVTSPEGEHYEITAPDDATDEQINQYIQSTIEPERAAQIKLSHNNVQPRTLLSKLGHQAGLMGRAAITGLTALPGMAADLPFQVANAFGANMPMPTNELQRLMTNLGVPAPENEIEQSAQNIMSMLAGTGAATKVAQLAQKAGVAIPEALTQLRSSDLFSTLLGGSASEIMRQNEAPPVVQALAGLAGASVPAAVKLAGGILPSPRQLAQTIPQETVSLAKRAQDLNIPVSATQLSDSRPLKAFASTINKLPFSGESEFAHRQQQAFNQAVAKTFGAQANTITPDVMAKARAQIGQTFESIAKNNTVKMDSNLLTDLETVKMQTRFLEPAQAQVVKNHIDDILEKAQAGELAGKAYQNKRSFLSQQARSGPYGSTLREIRDALDRAFERSVSNKEDAQKLQLAREQYRNMKTVENLAEKAKDGNLQASGLLNEVRNAHPDFAYTGGGEMGDLARIGQRFIKDPIQNSGSPERLTNLAAIGAGLFNWKIPAALATGRAFNEYLRSPWLARNSLLEAMQPQAKTSSANPFAALNVLSKTPSPPE